MGGGRGTGEEEEALPCHPPLLPLYTSTPRHPPSSPPPTHTHLIHDVLLLLEHGGKAAISQRVGHQLPPSLGHARRRGDISGGSRPSGVGGCGLSLLSYQLGSHLGVDLSAEKCEV